MRIQVSPETGEIMRMRTQLIPGSPFPLPPLSLGTRLVYIYHEQRSYKDGSDFSWPLILKQHTSRPGKFRYKAMKKNI